MQMTNFFVFSRIGPFSLEMAKKKKSINPFLVKDFATYYDVRLSRIISPGNNDEVKVYQFIPYQERNSEDAVMLSGFLYVRSKDLSIMQLEASAKYVGLTGIPNITNQQVKFTVTYREGIENYPIVESVKCDAEIEFSYNEHKYQANIHSMMFATDYPMTTKGQKMKHRDNLRKEIDKAKYNQAFWDNNPIVKRTEIEQQVVDDFNRLGFFGNMNFDEQNAKK